jgi:penicillin amidase
MTLIPPDPHGPLEGPADNPSEPRLLTRRDPTSDEPPTPSHSHLFAAVSRLRNRQARRVPPRPRAFRPDPSDAQAPIPRPHPLTPPNPLILNPVPTEPRPRRRFGKYLRLTIIVSEVLLALSIVAAICAVFYLRHAMRSSLPQLDGTLHVSGLSTPVTVNRDAHGVPSIHAANLDDLLFAQGYVTAQDRLWHMDVLRRHAAGELAELLGPSLLDHDREQRTLQLRAAADRAVAQLPPDQLHQLQAYAAGVNAFIDAHPHSLPVEFAVLHYTPAHWQPRDTLLVSLVMWQDLTTSFPTKLNRESLSAHLSPALLADLYPVGSWRDRPPTQPPTDLTADHGEVLQVPLDNSQSSVRPIAQPTARPEDLLHVSATLEPRNCEACRSGSNNWAVSATRSASGAPLLSNDMHLGLTVPDIWYQTTLHVDNPSAGAAQLDVTGFTIPGIPFIIVGRNAHVAWGFTNLGADVQDVRVEHLRGTGSNTEFQHTDGSWSPVTHNPEHIRVRGGRDVTLDVLTTTQTLGATTIPTPIISPLYPSDHRTLSLAWPIYDPSSLNDPFYAADTATSGASLVQALAAFGPSLNIIYADDAHHIGYHALGRIPIRGAAVQHPRELPSIAIPSGAPPPDEDADSADTAEQPQDNTAPSGSSAEPGQPAVDTEATPAPRIRYNIGSPISPIPFDALDPNQQWSGYIPYNELPAIADPPNGTLATANARITPDDYPYYVTDDWADPYRVERITKLLNGRDHLTPADMLAVQNDVHSAFDLLVAQRLAYALDHASSSVLLQDYTRLHQAADLLRQWNGDMTIESPAAAITLAARSELWPLLLTPQIAAHDHTQPRDSTAQKLVRLYNWGEADTALEKLLSHEPSRWLPPGYATWNDLLAAAVSKGLYTAHAPHDLSTWRYGNYHPVEIAHPIFGSHSLLSRVLGVATGTGLQPAPGDGVTVRASALHFGPSERFTADLASPSATNANITTGESEIPLSAFFLDQFRPWLNGTTLSTPLDNPDAVHTLTLQPN